MSLTTQITLKSDSADPSNTFVFLNEDHTLGNALRHVLMQDPDVVFCGYSMPHPMENKMHLRIQTKGVSAAEALRRALHSLSEACGFISEAFEDAVPEIAEENGSGAGCGSGMEVDA